MSCVEIPLETVFSRHASDEPLHYRVFVDPSFPPNIVPIIQEAVDDWQASLHSLAEFKVAVEHFDCAVDCSEGERVICIHMVQHGETRNGEAGDTSYHGQPERSLVRISTDNFAPDVANWRECTRITTTHELGHAMGLRHDRAGTIMALKGTYVAKRITESDVRQFLQVHRIE